MKYIMSICFSFYCLQIFCQSPTEEILVRKAIVEMFDGMFNADSARIRQVFHPEMRLMTIAADKSGVPIVQSTNIENFLKSVGIRYSLKIGQLVKIINITFKKLLV